MIIGYIAKYTLTRLTIGSRSTRQTSSVLVILAQERVACSTPSLACNQRCSEKDPRSYFTIVQMLSSTARRFRWDLTCSTFRAASPTTTSRSLSRYSLTYQTRFFLFRSQTLSTQRNLKSSLKKRSLCSHSAYIFLISLKKSKILLNVKEVLKSCYPGSISMIRISIRKQAALSTGPQVFHLHAKPSILQ